MDETSNERTSNIGRITAALERLRDGYQRDDAAALEGASRELDELGHAALALEGLDPWKRAAIRRLAFPLAWTSFEWEAPDIARVLSLPESIVAQVIATTSSDLDAEHEARRIQDEREWREHEHKRREAALERENLARAIACPVCAAAAGEGCRSVGKYGAARHAHAARAQAVRAA